MSSFQSTPLNNRHYIGGSKIPFDEDQKHEFKVHKCLTMDEIKPICRELKTMSPISRTLNGFLNTGKGGTIFLGVTDDGTIRGIPLTHYQMDHFCVALSELLKNYKPVVLEKMIRLNFVPVLSSTMSKCQNVFLSKRLESSSIRFKPHHLRQYLPCWCDSERKQNKEDSLVYVIEITVNPWDSSDEELSSLVKSLTKLHPIFEDEMGNVYIRKQGGNWQYTMQEIYEFTLMEVEQFYKSKQTT